MSGDRTYLIPAGIAGVMLLFGGTLVGFGKHLARPGDEARSWPSTDGKVVTSFESTGTAREPTTGLTQRTRVGFDYTYEVEGRAYTGHIVAYGTPKDPEISSRLSDGARVQVFYNPKDPSEAALMVDVEDPSGFFLWVGYGSMMLLGAPFGYLSYRMARARR